MPASVEIDSHSGFCGGVIHAINSAEDYLHGNSGHILYSLGDIVHNEEELARLRDIGMVTIDHEDLDQITDAHGRTLLIRAHGEPPQTYDKVRELGFDIIDCTCPVVLNIQRSIKDAYERLHADGGSGQILIFGKIGHAEVLGLVGQVDGDAIVVENASQLENLLNLGIVRTDINTDIFSQTTMSPVEYGRLHASLKERMSPDAVLTVHDTICRQVASRHKDLQSFAASHDIIIFVSGKSSSNGKVLSNLCKSVNIRTYNVGGVQDINPQWFRQDDRVGICGATSTPKWLLEQTAAFIENLH